MPWYGYVFWAWVAISIVVLVRRRFFDRDRRPADESTGPPVLEAVARLETNQPPPALEQGPSPIVAEALSSHVPTPPPPAPGESAPPPGSVATRSIYDVLAGLRMPDGLVPEAAPDDPRLHSVIRLAGPAVSAAPIAGALMRDADRLGFTVERVDGERALFRRDADRIMVSLVSNLPDPGITVTFELV